MIKDVQLSLPRKVSGDDSLPAFAALPAHDQSAFFNFIHRNRNKLNTSLMVDLGANIGLAALNFLDLLPHGRVLAIEPRERTRVFLTETIALNGIGDAVEVSPLSFNDPMLITKILDSATDHFLINLPTSPPPLHTLRSLFLGFQERDEAIAFFRINIPSVEREGLSLAALLDEAINILGPIGVIDELTGLVAVLAGGTEGETQLRNIQRGPSEVFNLVNRVDLFDRDLNPPWGSHEQLVIRQGRSLSIRSIGDVVEDREVVQDYDHRSAQVARWDWNINGKREKTSVDAFILSQPIITSCYLSIDQNRHRLFRNQSYFEAELWFNLRPRIEALRYEFRSNNVVPLEGRYVVIGGPIDNAYYHWVFNWCPRILILKDLWPEVYNDPSVKFIIDRRAQAEPFSTYLRLLNIPDDRIFYADDSCDYVLDSGVLVSFLSQTSYFPKYIEQFSKTIKSAVSTVDGPRRSRIWISRERFETPKRRVKNIDQIKLIMDEWGFEEVILENMSVEEQVFLFANAEVVAGVHGAGLANIIFCSPDCRVLFFDNERNIKNGLAGMFTVLAEICGLQYRLLPVKEDIISGVDYSDFSNIHNRDVIISERSFLRALKELLGKVV